VATCRVVRCRGSHIFQTIYSQRRMASSGMLRRVAVGRTDVSEELSTSFIMVTRIGELRTTLAATTNRRTLRRNTRAKRRNIQEDAILHSHSREKLKSYNLFIDGSESCVMRLPPFLKACFESHFSIFLKCIYEIIQYIHSYQRLISYRHHRLNDAF
jgi:hypothetical protein